MTSLANIIIVLRTRKKGAEEFPLEEKPGERHQVGHGQGRPVDLRPPPVLQLLHGEHEQGGGEEDGGKKGGKPQPVRGGGGREGRGGAGGHRRVQGGHRHLHLLLWLLVRLEEGFDLPEIVRDPLQDHLCCGAGS